MITIEYALKANPAKVKTIKVPDSFVGYFGEHVATTLDIPLTDLVMAHEKSTHTGRKSQ